MKNLRKIVFRGGCIGFSQTDLFSSNDRAVAMLKFAQVGNYNFVKVCRGNEIAELHRDKHKNFIYREYEKD